jgi:hypothetical protein
MNLPHHFFSAWKIPRSAPFLSVNILPRVFLASSSRFATPINLFLLNAASAFCFPVFPSCFLLPKPSMMPLPPPTTLLSRKRAASTVHHSPLRYCNACRKQKPPGDFVKEGRPDRPHKTCKGCRVCSLTYFSVLPANFSVRTVRSGNGLTIGLEAKEDLLPLAQLRPLPFLSLFSPRLPSVPGCPLTRAPYRRPFYLPKFKLGDTSVRLLYEGCTLRVFPYCCTRLC